VTEVLDPFRDESAQRRAEVQYAVSRVLAHARNEDEALDELLPAIADALTWDCGRRLVRRPRPHPYRMRTLLVGSRSEPEMQNLHAGRSEFLQRRRVETLLEENEERYATIVNGALDAIVAIDDHGLITATRQDSAVEIWVADSGRGIDPAFLPFAFDRFRQAPAARRGARRNRCGSERGSRAGSRIHHLPSRPVTRSSRSGRSTSPSSWSAPRRPHRQNRAQDLVRQPAVLPRVRRAPVRREVQP
jgi:PAS domain-containing protein